jgi:hypothetical protein
MATHNAVQLSTEEWQHIVYLGIERHIQELEDKLQEALQQIALFEIKYNTSFSELQETGLPENAGLEAHEDYVEWSSWERYRADLQEQLKRLRALLEPEGV